MKRDPFLVESKSPSQNLEVGQRSLPHKSTYTKAAAFATHNVVAMMSPEK